MSSSCSSTTSSSSHSDPERASGAKRVACPPRRPGFQRLGQLGFLEMSELREMRRAAQRAFAARAVTTADASRTERREPGSGPQVAGVTVLLVCWHVHPRFNGALSAAILCGVALFLYSVSAVWIRIRYRHLFHATSRADYTDHACRPFSSGCDSTACKMYTGAADSSLNRSQGPSNNFYRFVRDGWKQEHRLLSVLGAAEDMMYGRALNTIEWAPRDTLKPVPVQSVASSVVRSFIELAKSCIETSESSLHRLKMFMAEHNLPWPLTSRWDLLEILLHLSGNWNLHLWLQVTFVLRPSRKVTGNPVLKISHSAAFRTWIASMRTFAGQPRGLAQTVRYQQYVRSMQRLLDVCESQAGEPVATIDAMNRLTLAVVWYAIAEREQRIQGMSVRNLTERTTTGISAGRLLLLLNKYFISSRRLSSIDIVRVENPGILRAAVFVLKSAMWEALTLGLRVAHELGWTADQRIADVTLNVMGLPTSLQSRRCLVPFRNSVGVGWLRLFPTNRGFQTQTADIRGNLMEVLTGHSKSVLDVQAQGDGTMWSLLASVLSEPTPRAGFFIYWLNLMSVRWQLQHQDLTNVLKPGFRAEASLERP
ncbi:hypothetical protein V5799_029173 [Amblyomma americanum]|uniref:Uncharacterized protein n=1 Tax=Amblyomma americanum TaxID=6943 RepID=A0AAQ4ERS9_AMBAM